MMAARFGSVLAAIMFTLLAAGSPRAEPQQGFAGSAACAECHAAEAKAWSGSDHAWALKAPDSRNMLGDFKDASFTHKGVTSRFFMKEGRYFVETDGPSGKLETFEVRYAIGHRPLQQYLVETTNGRLQVLDIAWDVGGKRWFHLYPDQELAAGDAMHWTGTYKNWQARCATCHQTGFDKGYDFPSRTYESHWSELTVGCEACHGPGKDHVAAARKGNPRQSLMPKLGPGQQQNEIDVCGPCHSRREAFSQLQPPAGSAFHEHYALSPLTPDLYFGDGQQNAEVFILGSFLQSKMKAKGVTCSNCHEGHSGALLAEGNAVCTQCHGETGRTEFPTLRKADYDTPAHHHHPPGSEAAQCVTCHMPERSYMLIDPRRDHFFRRPDPLQAKAAGAPDVCTGCHTDETPEWAAGKIAMWFPDSDRSWQDRGALIAFTAGDRQERTLADLKAFIRNRELPVIARATAVRALGGEPLLTREDAEALLREEDGMLRAGAASGLRHLPPEERIALLRPLLADPDRAVRQVAATELAGAGVAALPSADDEAYRKAMQEFVDSRLANADTPESHMALGGFALTRRQWDEAAAAFRTATEIDPQLPEAWMMLARISEARGQAEEAKAALASGTQALPRNADLAFARADLAARQGDMPDAIAWYRRGLGIDEKRPDAWMGLGVAAFSSGNAGLALDAARKAAELAPKDPMPHVLEAVARLQQGQRNEAREAGLRARSLAPGIELPPAIDALLKGGD